MFIFSRLFVQMSVGEGRTPGICSLGLASKDIVGSGDVLVGLLASSLGQSFEDLTIWTIASKIPSPV